MNRRGFPVGKSGTFAFTRLIASFITCRVWELVLFTEIAIHVGLELANGEPWRYFLLYEICFKVHPIHCQGQILVTKT